MQTSIFGRGVEVHGFSSLSKVKFRRLGAHFLFFLAVAVAAAGLRKHDLANEWVGFSSGSFRPIEGGFIHTIVFLAWKIFVLMSVHMASHTVQLTQTSKSGLPLGPRGEDHRLGY